MTPEIRHRGSGYPEDVESPGSTPHPEQATPPGPSTTDTDQVATEADQIPPRPAHLARDLAIYTGLRLALVIVLTVALAFFMPLIVALLFAIIVQLPLAWLVFSGPRSRVNDAIAVSTARRRAERARLQSALSGDPDTVTEPRE